MASKLRVPVEVFENNFEFLVEHIDVAALEKHLHGHQLLKPFDSEVEKVLNSDDYLAAEKSGILVQHAISFGNRGVNELIKLLEAERNHVGHTRVLSKLRADSQEYAKRYSPVLFVLDDVAEELPLGIDVKMLQVSLMKTGIISAKDIHGSGNRSMRDRMTYLITAVKEKGVDGLVKLIQSLEQIKQAEFAELLRKRVQDMIDEGCVLNEEDSKLLEDAKFRVRTPSEPLLDVSSSSQPAQVQKLREVQNDEYRERVVVMISMTKFLELKKDDEEMMEVEFNGEYQLSKSLESIGKMLEQIKFTVVDLGPMLADIWHKKKADRLRSIVAKFEDKVSRFCNSTCQVVILIAGIAFSNKDQKTRLLVENSPMFSKHMGDCISEEELKSCLDTLSTPYVTVIADNHIETEQMLQSQSSSQQSVSLWRNLCTNSPQRVVISYCYKAVQKQVQIEQSFGLIMDALVHFLNNASKYHERAHISHRQLCDMLSLYCSYKLGTKCSILPCVQGDVDRGLFGNNNYPYQLYFPVQVQMLASDPMSFEVKHINVPYGEMFGLTDKSSVKIGHMCRPTELVSGNVFDLQQFSCKVDVDEVEKLLQLLKEIYNTMFEGIDHSSREKLHILFVYPSYDSTSSQRSPVAVDSPDPEDELKDYICNQSQLLRLAYTEKAVLKVIKNGVEYMIKDGWGDIKMKSQVPNVQQVKSFLEIYARFKMVKFFLKNTKSNVEHHASRQTCVLYQYNPSPLLTSGSHQNGEFTHPTASINLSRRTEGFWCLEADSSVVDIYFSKVRLISSVEVKGDSEPDIGFEKIEYRSKCSLVKERFEAPSNDTPVTFELKRKGKSDIVSAQYLRLLLVTQDEPCERCGIAFRVLHNTIQPIHVLKHMQLLNHRELTDGGYTIMPNNNGAIKLGSDEWVVIIAPQRMSHIPLEFDFLHNHNLVSLELTYPSFLSADNVQPLKEIKIECYPNGSKSIPPTNTIFSTTTFDFRNPVRASHLRLVPKNKTPKKMCIQLQIYGNKSCVGENLTVTEGDHIQVGFAYSYNHNVYLNIVCMEETGMVSSVLSKKKLKECSKSESGTLEWLEDHSALIHTFIPDNYLLRGSEIRDTYKIIASSQPFDLNPLCQAGANDYYSPHTLDLASLTSNVPKESGSCTDEAWWYDHEALVRVQKNKTK